jgi:hypothetical protein
MRYRRRANARRARHRAARHAKKDQTMSMHALARVPRLIAGFAGVAAALSVSAAFPAVTIDGIYQESSTTLSISPPEPTGCSGVAQCFVVFSRLPAGKELVVMNVSCTIVTTAGGIDSVLLVPQLPNGVFLLQFQWLQHVRTEGTRVVLNNTTLAPIGKRQRPIIRINSSQQTTPGRKLHHRRADHQRAVAGGCAGAREGV